MNTSTDVLQALTVNDAANLLCSLVEPERKIEQIGMHEALGKVLADDYITPFPMPPFRRAAMDGYAVRYKDIYKACSEHPVTLEVAGEIKAGSSMDVPNYTSRKISARIFTGAPVPDGWDTVIVQEAIPIEERLRIPDAITLHKSFRQGEHIAEAGEDMLEGTVALAKGERIGAKEIAILASFGQSKISVYEQPSVCIIPIGDELLTLGMPLIPSHIYDANSHMVAARLQELGANVHRMNPVPDHIDAIECAINLARSQSAIVITIGGVSVGEYDFVAQAAEQAGGEALFRKVLMRPGKPTSAFKLDNQLIISLSGNPSACFAGLELLVKPVINKAGGIYSYSNQFEQAILTADVVKGCPVTRFVRSKVYLQEGKLFVEPLGRDRSGNIAAFAYANALAVIPPGARGASKGEIVNLLHI